MRLEVVLPNESTAVEPRRIVELARLADELGYTTAWLPDHLLPPADYGRTYGGVYEPLITMTAITAATRRLAVGTSILILPLRDPFLLAKQVATIERLAPGRVVLGVGLGWDAAEFANVGARFDNRSTRADEALALIGHLFTVGHGPFSSRYHPFESGFFAPRPSGPVPILVGGTSPAALRRASRFADIWQAVGLPPQEFADCVSTLRSMADHSIEAAVRVEMDEQRPLDDAIAEVRAFADAGADRVAVWFGSVDGFGDRMRSLAGSLDLEPPQGTLVS